MIEDGAFIGSDTQLVAPVTVGKGAYVGSRHRPIREDVPPGALGRQRRQAAEHRGLGREAKRRAKSKQTDRSDFETQPELADQDSHMCGIIGYIGPKDVVPVLIDGLRRLEYRGYDSAGVAVVRDGAIELRRSAGKLSQPRST